MGKKDELHRRRIDILYSGKPVDLLHDVMDVLDRGQPVDDSYWSVHHIHDELYDLDSE
jgi:hypothetical protein